MGETTTVPALSLGTLGLRDRSIRIVALITAALMLASLAAFWAAPVEAKDWTPQIKAARRAQIYWESAMRAADAEVKSVRKAKKQAKAKLKQARVKRSTAIERRRVASRALAASRTELRAARVAAQEALPTESPSDVVAPAPPDVFTAAVALQLALLEEVGLVPATGLRSPPDEDRGSDLNPDAARAAERSLELLEKRVKKQKRHRQRTERKAQRASRAIRQVRSQLATLKARERSAIARREAAERSLGSWILAMEHYARGRAANMGKYRPGIDSPFAWPARGRISQSYSRSHDGLDIAGYQGTAIRAAAFGVVSYIGWNPWDEHGRAFMIVVAHVGGLETLYGHILPSRHVRIGQAVRQGEVIGRMGSTGNSTGTHLHFEVRRGRTTVNPLGYL